MTNYFKLGHMLHYIYSMKNACDSDKAYICAIAFLGMGGNTYQDM